MKGMTIIFILFSNMTLAEDISLCRQGWAQYQYGEYEKSIELFNQCIDQGELTQVTLAQTYRNMGIVANGSGRSEDALTFYDKAIALGPDEVWYDLVNKGNAYSALGRFDEAIGSYQQALAVKPHFNEAYYNMGLVYNRMGRLDDAIKHYKLASKHGLNTPHLKERIHFHGIELEKIALLTDVSKQTLTNTYHPVKNIAQVSTLDSYTCQSFVGRSFSAHPQSELIKGSKTYSFVAHGIDFKFPALPLKNYNVADHLNNTERNVKDSYLVFADDLMGEISAAVVVTEFPPHMTDAAQLMAMTKQIESGLTKNFGADEVLMRELASDFGPVLEIIVMNRGPSACFPTSAFKKSSPDKETMGISRFIYKGNLMIEFALIVEQPEQVEEEDFTDFARQQMDQFWSGVEFRK